MRILIVGVGTVPDFFHSCETLFLLLGFLVHHYCSGMCLVLLCCVWLLSLRGLLFSEERQRQMNLRGDVWKGRTGEGEVGETVIGM